MKVYKWTDMGRGEEVKLPVEHEFDLELKDLKLAVAGVAEQYEAETERLIDNHVGDKGIDLCDLMNALLETGCRVGITLMRNKVMDELDSICKIKQ